MKKKEKKEIFCINCNEIMFRFLINAKYEIYKCRSCGYEQREPPLQESLK